MLGKFGQVGVLTHAHSKDSVLLSKLARYPRIRSGYTLAQVANTGIEYRN